MGDETKNILKNVTEFTARLHEDEDFRSTVATALKEMGYIEAQNDAAGGRNPKLNTEQVHNEFVKAVNMSMKYAVDLRKDDPLLKEKLKKLLVDTLPSNVKQRQIKHYLTDKLPDRSIQEKLESPLDFLKEGCIKPSAKQIFFKKLIECQFQIKWNTDAAGRPIPFNYYDFCNEERKQWPDTTALKSLKNQVRRAHVLVQLFQMSIEKLSQNLTSDDLCPSVYIRTNNSTWQERDARSNELVKTIDTGGKVAPLPFPWMNDSIRSYILDQAEIIPDADSEACLDKHTLYWVVIQDSDFHPGDKLKLNDIGQTQVYVGKADKGINGRWLAGHCKNMMKCLESIRRMKEVGTYEPLLLKDVQLVEARLVLAKLRRNKNSALFVMQTFDQEIEKAEKALNSAQEAYDAEEIARNKRNLNRAKEALENAKKKAEKDLKEAESQNIEGRKLQSQTPMEALRYEVWDEQQGMTRLLSHRQ